MYILLDACKHPTFLRVLYFGYLFWEILAVVIPIGLIIMLMIDFTKAVVINKEDEQVKSMKLVGKRIMYAVFIFAGVRVEQIHRLGLGSGLDGQGPER